MCCASLSAACCIECVLELLNTQIMPGLPFLSLVLVVVAVAVEACPLEDRSFLALCKLQRRNIQLPNRFTKSRITKLDSDGGYIIVFQRKKGFFLHAASSFESSNIYFEPLIQVPRPIETNGKMNVTATGQ